MRSDHLDSAAFIYTGPSSQDATQNVQGFFSNYSSRFYSTAGWFLFV